MKIIESGKVVFSLLSLTFLFVVTSCSSGDKGDVPARLEFQTYEFDCIAEDNSMDADSRDMEPGDSLMKYMSFSGSGILPKDIGNADVKMLRDSLLSMAGVEFVSESSAAPVLDSCYSIIDRKVSLDDGCSNSTSSLSITLANPRVIVWQCFRYQYMYHAAHGVYGTSYLNYSIDNNRILKLQDIFKPGYEKELGMLLTEKVKEKDVDLFDPDASVGVPDDFEISTNGINFIWSIYSIAPYSEGEIKVEVNSYEVADLLTTLGSSIFN